MLRNVDIAVLRTFVEVAHARSFTKATERVFRTQSSVSLQVKRLEQEIGRTLFFRDGRGVRLTPDGEALLEYAMELMKINDKIFTRFTQKVAKSSVSVGINVEFTFTKLASCFARLKHVHPELSLKIKADTTVGLEDGLASGEYDLILTQCEEQERIPAVMSWQESLLWVGTKDAPIDFGDVVPLVVPQAGSLMRARILDTLRANEIDADIVMQTPTTLGIQTAVGAGLGISAMNRNSVPPFLQVIPSPDPLPTLPSLIFALFPRQGPLDPATETVIRCIRQCFDRNMFY